MSGYHWTLRVSRDGRVIGVRPPAGADEQDHEALLRVKDALPDLMQPGEKTQTLPVVDPTVWPHDKWFGSA